jgi:hypothetical protein
VVLFGDDAAIATAPQVPAAATASVADTARSIRLDLSNRSPFPGLLDSGMVTCGAEEGLRGR